MSNEQLENTKPIIFVNKRNNKFKVIPLNVITNTSGLIRHFPPAIKEWSNSIYAFNSNSIKNLSIADKNLIRLIKSYFNLYFNVTLLKSKRIATRFRRLAVKKIFISKTELKHTNSKVVITLYVFNEERRVLIRKIKRLEAILFPSSFTSILNDKKKFLSIREKLDIIKSQEKNISLVSWLYEFKSYLVEQIKLEKDNLLVTKKIKLLKEKELIINNLNEDLIKLINIISTCESDRNFHSMYEKIYRNFLYKTHLEREISVIAYYKLLLNLNKSKFENKFILKLKPLIAKLYNKEIEFNIINLKTLSLNSDIFTEAVSLKLKNRNNKLLRVLRSSLSMVKLSKVNKMREQYNKINIKELWINKVNDLNINLIDSKYYNKDILNKLLLDLFNDSSYIDKENGKSKINSNNSLIDCILNSLMHKNMAGIRLEAKGRLTRRFTASRSVFKIKWKGSLKNINSSYRGLSSVLLRGHAKSNVQYSLVNSKTRNGAFGLKGWISSK